MNKSRDSPKEFGVLGREVLGEECSLIRPREGGKVKKPLEVRKNQPELKRDQASIAVPPEGHGKASHSGQYQQCLK